MPPRKTNNDSASSPSSPSRAQINQLLWKVLEYIKSEDPWTPSCEVIGITSSSLKSSSSSSSSSSNTKDELDYARIAARKVKKVFTMINKNVAQQLYDEYSNKRKRVEDAIMNKTKVGKNAGNTNGLVVKNEQFDRMAHVRLGSDDTVDHFKDFLLSFGESYYKSIISAPRKEMPPLCWGAFELVSIGDRGDGGGDPNILVYSPKTSSWPFSLILQVLSEDESE